MSASLSDTFNTTDLPPANIKKAERPTTWLISFTDVISLMLAFFVLLFSMKEPDQENWTKVQSMLDGEAKQFYGMPFVAGNADQNNISSITKTKEFALNYIEALIKHYIESTGSVSTIDMVRYEDYIIMSVPLFDNSYKQEAQNFARALGRIDNKIEMVVYAQKPSELTQALAKAQSFGKILKEAGYLKDITLLSQTHEDAQALTKIADFKGADMILRLTIHNGDKK